MNTTVILYSTSELIKTPNIGLVNESIRNENIVGRALEIISRAYFSKTTRIDYGDSTIVPER